VVTHSGFDQHCPALAAARALRGHPDAAVALSVTARPVVRRWARCPPVDVFRLMLQEIKSVVDKFADIARVQMDVDPDDKAEIFRQLGLKLTCHPGDSW
jgi:hypothetical protein